MKQEDKLKQIQKEVKICVAALAMIIVFWALAGFGISRFDITVWNTPLWAITGCLGTWIFSIVLVTYLIKKVFKDFDLDEEEADER